MLIISLPALLAMLSMLGGKIHPKVNNGRPLTVIFVIIGPFTNR